MVRDHHERLHQPLRAEQLSLGDPLAGDQLLEERASRRSFDLVPRVDPRCDERTDVGVGDLLQLAAQLRLQASGSWR
jgi:hypothetical protein